MARFTYDAADNAGYDPCLVCNALDRTTDVRFVDLATLNVRRDIEHTTVGGMEVKAIPRYLPEIEFLQYVTNHRYWRSAIADGDAFIGVGGSNHSCLPLQRDGKAFCSWTATPFWEDRRDRLNSASLLRRVRDRVSKPIMEAIEGRLYRAADPVLVLSEYTADRIAEHHRLDRSRIEVVPYPIDTDLFNLDGPAKPADDRPTVLFVGRFNDPRKNTRLLLEAIATVKAEFPAVRLLLIGDEPNADLRRAIENYGLEDAVEWLDYVDNADLPDYYRGADAFAIPSKQEGLAIVGLEAMACGTPVVSTDCGGPEGYIRDGENGYLVDGAVATAFADRLCVLLGDRDVGDRLGTNARELIVEKYAASVVRSRFVQFLDDIAG